MKVPERRGTHRRASGQAATLGDIFRSSFRGELALDPDAPVEIDGKPVAALRLEGKLLKLDFSLPDSFTAQTGGNATVFAVAGDEFVRISTSVKSGRHLPRRGDARRRAGTRLRGRRQRNT